MDISSDSVKNARNILKRGLSFERAADFDFDGAVFATDTRREYGEERIVAVGYLDGRLHVLCFVETETGIRVIRFLPKRSEKEILRSFRQECQPHDHAIPGMLDWFPEGQYERGKESWQTANP
jgi:uncharacterized DUF497 family protein